MTKPAKPYGVATQRAMIVRALNQGKKLDWLSGFRLCGTSKLSTRLGEIKKDTGMKIDYCWVQRGSGSFKRYWKRKN